MDEKIRRKKREITQAQHNHWLRHNFTLHEPGTKLTKHRTIKQNSVPTRWYKTNDSKQDPTPLWATIKDSTRSRSTPRTTKILARVNKWSEEGYTTVFHPGKKGVTVHNPGTLTMTTSKLPVLQGYKPHGAKLWTVSANKDANKLEETHNVYSLPLMEQSIRYLHTAAGYSPEETWTNAINAGNYNTWPGLTATAVRRHFL